MLEKLYGLYRKIGLPVSTDSRNIIPGSIFFALKGDNFDGNIYADDALAKGAALAVIDDVRFAGKNKFVTENVLATLQQLAANHRVHERFNVFALTGTNGKTTTKELIRLVLSQKYKCWATKGNLNNHIGVPLTILSAPAGTEILIIEMGANHIGEIALLCNIAQPDAGMITNIGKAHLEGFGGFEGVIKAKSEMYSFLKSKNNKIIANYSDTILTDLLKGYENTEYYGNRQTNCYAKSLCFDGQLKAKIAINENCIDIQTQMFGRYNITNVLAAIKIGLLYNVDVVKMISAIEAYTPENNRSQILETSKNTLILDSYNANPSSMKLALESFAEIRSDNKITILGEMKELGESGLNEHSQLIEEAEKTQSAQNIFVGSGFLPFSHTLAYYFNDTDSLISYLIKENISGKLIFVKGSRANKLETIVPYL